MSSNIFSLAHLLQHVRAYLQHPLGSGWASAGHPLGQGTTLRGPMLCARGPPSPGHPLTVP